MSIAKARREYYIQKAEDAKNGILKGISLAHTFPKLSTILPVIPPGYQVLWTANSGIGKTQTWIGMILYSIYKQKKLKLSDTRTILVITLLEDTKEMFIDRLYSMFFYELFGIIVDGFELQSYKGSLTPEKIIMLETIEKEIDFLLEDCEVIDNVYNPTGLYKWCRSISNKYGTHHTKEKEFTKEDKSTYIETVYSHYELNDAKTQFLLIVDNLNNLQQEVREGKLLTQLETINMWSRSYCRLQIAKHWQWSIINVIQQSADSEKATYDNKGKLIVDRCKPSLEGLGNSKECQRDHFIVIGWFAPDRYGVKIYPEWEGYNTEVLRDNFRSMIILKSNLSRTNVEIPMYFNGAASIVRELPTVGKMQPIYDKIKRGEIL